MPPIPLYDFTTKDYGVANMIASMPDAFFSGYERGQKRLKEKQEADAIKGEFQSQFQSVLGLGGGDQNQNIAAQPSSPVAALGLGAPQQEPQGNPRIDQAFDSAQPKMPSFQAMQGGGVGDIKSKVYNSLIKNGISPVAAVGLTGNLAQESNFRTDARNRGDGRDGSDSIGLAQWNQDRAKNLMGFAASKGLDWRDPEVQGAFIAHELKTTEGRAGQALAKAQTPEDAARAAIGYFRPAGFTWNNPMLAHGAENRIAQARRAAQEFGVGGQQQASAPAQGATPAQGFVAPQQGQQPQQSSYAQQLMARAQALARQAQATDSRPLMERALKVRKEALEAQQKETYGFQAFGDQLLRTDPRTGQAEIIMSKPVNDVEQRLKEAQIKKYDAEAQGKLRPVNKNEGTIPAGYQAVRDQNGDIVEIRPIKGSEAEADALEKQQKMGAKKRSEISSYNSITDAIGDAQKLVSGSSLPSVGKGGQFVADYVPFTTNASDLKNTLNTIKAKTAFGELQKMREASPTGAALGGIAVRELELLQDSVASLEQSQSEAQFLTNLRRVQENFDLIIHGKIMTPNERQSFRKNNSQINNQQQQNATPQEGQTGTLPDGRRVIIRNGKPEIMQ
jgi:hypothetical protein